MASTADFDYVREQCLRQLRRLRAEADDSERELANLHLPLNAEARLAFLTQLQQGVQAAYDYVNACRRLAKFLRQQAEHPPQT